MRWSAEKPSHGEPWDAAHEGDLETVRACLEAGTDVNSRGRVGKTLLGAACSRGYLNIVRELLCRGADLEMSTEKLRTPLMDAAHNGSLEIVQLLVDAGARVDAADDNGDTPISHAYRGSSGRVLKYLVEIEGAPFGDVLKGVTREQVEERIAELFEKGYL